MPLSFEPTRRKRVMLAALDVAARVMRSVRGPVPAEAATNRQVDRILVVELWNIGDVVLAMPFLAQLHVQFPRARITLLAGPHARILLEGTGLVDEFIETNIAWSGESTKINPFAYRWAELFRLWREMRRRKFDLAFKARMHVREHLVLALSGARRRVAFGFGSGDGVLSDVVPVDDPYRQKSDDWLQLLKPFGLVSRVPLPRLQVSQSERRWADEWLRTRGVLPSQILVGIHPGASVMLKRWPLERFREIADTLARRERLRVLAFVDPVGYGAPLGEVDGVIAARVNLREMIALIARCSVLACNDSGPMHIAGALGVPTVAVFGSGINRWFAPLGDGHRLVTLERTESLEESDFVPVRPYDLAGIPTSRVLDSVNEALSDQP